MKAEELMIGDWIGFNGSPYQIEEISKKGWVHLTANGVRVPMTTDYLLGVLEGVPLTTEILERNFHEPNDGVVWWKNDEPFYHVECLPLNGMRIIMPYTQYVHELQHALRLAGIDKEIKLED